MSKYDDIKTAAELVAEVRAHGLSLDQEDICRAQDIFGNSPIEELVRLANDIEYYEEFDTEDHVMGLMEAKKNGFRGVPSLKELVEDADAIEKMIEELYDALHDVESEYYEEQEEYLS